VLTPLPTATYRTMLGLLAATGIRVGEAIALDRCDVELGECRLVIRDGKGGGRQLPLHTSTAEALAACARVRDRLCPSPTTPAFFVSTAGTRLIYECFRRTFAKLRSTAGLDSRRPLPRAHDLRHGFAVQTLLDWHRADLDVAARLPLLGAWMGHRRPASTYYYLQAAPELLARGAAPPRPRDMVMSALAPTLQAFFTERLIGQLQASPNTIVAYRDTLRLLLCFAQQRTGIPPNRLDLGELDAELVAAFLDHLEHDRGNSTATRNTRLAAIRSLFGYAAHRHPEHSATIARGTQSRSNARSRRRSRS
jgi:site-specific recombinase XerD